MSRFDCFDTPINQLKIIQRKPIEDSRGFLSRFYCAEEFKAFGFNKAIQQINHTLTRQKGAVRGLHYQHPPFAETKLVSCIKGEIFDIAVDIRKNSPTFLHWHGEILSEHNQRSLLIPEGFAHGFQTLTEDCELIYLHTAPYNQASEGALNILDKAINVQWPIDIKDLSERDRNHPMLQQDFQGLTL
ncbi:MAG TPA: dTDP-4-dehydrorhamnose 3,5-epimerase [Methylophilaceae bacterium]|nr:dTDP-4-dehydrorhamnose 3,5-epimerase [Methylophilaceae bacterium]HAJ71516.1 dTDP-4-dehydrorhamnose 3,5-epimerase [Methylophilaceae bacterium]